jgi:hypothetical protein
MTAKALIALLVLLCIACSTNQPIHNITNHNIPQRGDAQLSSQEISQAIKDACVYKRWQPKQLEPGVIQAEITVRGRHTAVILISYDTDSYSIDYERSTGLDHRGNEIHRNYNKWVILLDEQISDRLEQASKLNVSG